MAQLKEGMKAPSFEGIDQDGNLVKLSDFAGKKWCSIFIQKTIRQDVLQKPVIFATTMTHF